MKRNTENTLVIVIAVLLTLVACTLFYGWLVMLLFGGFHSWFGWPALGYWPCCAIGFALSFFMPRANTSK
jgi:hypothetical protein